MPVLLLLLYLWVGGKGKDDTYFSYIYEKNIVLSYRNSQRYLTYIKISIKELLFSDVIELRSFFMFFSLKYPPFKKGLGEESLNSCCLGQDHVPGEENCMREYTAAAYRKKAELLHAKTVLSTD